MAERETRAARHAATAKLEKIRAMSATIDGALAEGLRQMKHRRGGLKANLTKMIKGISLLTTSDDNLQLVKERLGELDNAYKVFQKLHEQYTSLLDRDTERQDSVEYGMVVTETVARLTEHTNLWIIDAQRRKRRVLDEINPEDSVSQVSSKAKSRTSRHSKASSGGSGTSSTSQARLQAAATKAALVEESKALQSKQALDQEELRLKQRREALDLQVQIAKMEATERTYAEAESVVSGNSTSDHVHVKFTHSTPVTQTENVSEPVSLGTPIIRHPLPARQAAGAEALSDTLAQMLNASQAHQQSLVEALQLPKTEIMTFDGDPIKYWLFMRSFDNVVDKESVSDSAKLARLLQYTSGHARKVIQPCMLKEPSEGYSRARQLLHERFGNEYAIAESWIKKITDRPPIKPNDAAALQDLADELMCCSETLNAMGRLSELSSQRSLLQIIEKLPFYLQTSWLKEARLVRQRRERMPNIEDVVGFVCAAAEEANDPVFGNLGKKEQDKSQKAFKGKFQGDKHNRRNRPQASFTAQAEVSPAASQAAPAESKPQSSASKGPDGKPALCCAYCGKGHSLFSCKGFKDMKPPARLTFTRSKRLCDNCLQAGHFALSCSSSNVCTVPGCGKKHTKFLHIIRATHDGQGNVPAGNSAQTMVAQDNSNMSADCYSCEKTREAPESCKVALPIVALKVRGSGDTSFIPTYALLDTGSTHSFCSDELKQKLGVTGLPEIMSLTTLEKANKRTDTMVVSLELCDMQEENLVSLPRVFTRPKLPISKDAIVSQQDLDKWDHLRDILLPEVDTNKVHILIGQDAPEIMVPKEVREGGKGEPYATRTVMGWTLNGPVGRGNAAVTSHFVNVHADTDLQKQVECFWKLDGIGNDGPTLSVSDKKAISVWEDSVSLTDGHYMMDIPFKNRPPNLPNNQSVAGHRLQLLGKRLQKDPELKGQYVQSMQELFAKGYAEKVPQAELSKDEGRVWYLPHHPVRHPRKPGKVRIVFDCAAKCKNVSLNDQVHQGPDLTNKLIGVLLRFRQEQVALKADIEGMFHQVKVSPQDRSVLRFLWWDGNDPTKTVQACHMNSHLFGGVWSPSCANFALKRTAQDNARDFSTEAIETVDKNFYVDDCLKSVCSVEQGNELVSQLCVLLSRGGFRLTKWVSNSREVLKSIPEQDRAKDIQSLDLNTGVLPAESTLGVLWQVGSDIFTFIVRVQDKPRTRRGLLSIVSSVYDPLGFVCPFVLVAKMLFQELCRLKCGWDEEIPDAIGNQWGRWLEDLPLLRKMAVPRCVKPQQCKAIVSYQLHHFSDASEKAYGAVSFLRLTDCDGNVACCLLMAKGKLAPLKVATIPRLELQAAVTSARLDNLLRRELQIQVHESFFWTDSMIVLQYINNETKRFHTFVANRIAEIHEHSSPSQWRHIDTGSNPADDVSRGMSAQELVVSERWTKGPGFLWLDEGEWPVTPVSAKALQNDDPEVKPQPQVYVTGACDEPGVMDTLFGKYSSWYKLKRAVAWLLRAKQMFVSKGGKPPDNPRHLTVEELKLAEQEIIKHIQTANFGDIDLRSSSVAKLSPVKQSGSGIWCVGGRLGNSNLTDDAKHQWILPFQHPVVDLIISHFHAATGHSGIEYTLAELRQRFWIVKGRAAVKRVIRKCVPCRRRHAPTMTQKMADLPEDRVTPGLPPFSQTGVDYFGPILIKRARSEVKRYGCLFTCLVTRAVHIEVSHSLDTDSFINALRRFISRRGQPHTIRSDNGTNFVGSERELRDSLRQWNQDRIEDFLKQREIVWKFNPPAASHMGGVWERQIRTVRSILGALVKQQVLDDEGLTTLMCEVEGIVNGRPITRLSDDPRDAEPLTPNHLLLLRGNPLLPPGNFVKQDLYRRRWRQVQYLADIFWRRWIREYLPCLQQRQKWLQPRRNLQVGDLVLMKCENTPRSSWPLGLVQETFPGKDGHVRSVQLKTQTSVLVRPTDKLCLLEGVAE